MIVGGFEPKLNEPLEAVMLKAALPTAQLNEALPLALVVSVAVTFGLKAPAVLGVPEISPDELLIERPAGSPEAP